MVTYRWLTPPTQAACVCNIQRYEVINIHIILSVSLLSFTTSDGTTKPAEMV